jgi:hypothetical protein
MKNERLLGRRWRGRGGRERGGRKCCQGEGGKAKSTGGA